MASSAAFSFPFSVDLLVPFDVVAGPLRGPLKLLKSSRFDRPTNVLLPLVLNSAELFVFSVDVPELLACAANVAKLNWLTDAFDRFGTDSAADVSTETVDFWASDAKLRPESPPNTFVADLPFSLTDGSSVAGVEVALNESGVKGDDAFAPFSFAILNVKVGESVFCSPTNSLALSVGFAAPNPPNILVAGDDGVALNAVDPNNGFDAAEIKFGRKENVTIELWRIQSCGAYRLSCL